jgi:phosphoglycolate phosphatase
VNQRFDFSCIKAIVFDFDGTLAKLNIDFSVMRSSIRNLTRDFRIPVEVISDLYVLEMIDAGVTYLNEISPAGAVAFESVAHELVSRLETEAADEGVLFDSTRMLLAELAGRSIRTGVVTRNCRIAVLKVFPDIASFCQTFLTREDTAHVKPHPEHLRSALRALGVEPVEAIMVGDHPLDILLGRETGTYTVGVLTGHSGREDLRTAKADLIIDKVSDIINICF